MRPIGRQWASGLSLLFSASRLSLSSLAHGRNGKPSLSPLPMFQNKPSLGGMVASASGAPAAPPTPPESGKVRTFSQRPDKSGLPSEVRGAGALRFGLPSGVRGTPAVGYGGHCAESGGEMAAM